MNQTNGTIHTDFELEQYLLELYHEVNSLVYADEDGTSKENKFTEHVMELLAESGETESIRLCPCKSSAKSGHGELKTKRGFPLNC